MKRLDDLAYYLARCAELSAGCNVSRSENWESLCS